MMRMMIVMIIMMIIIKRVLAKALKKYLAGVGVVKAHQHLALVLLGKELIQQGCLGMPYVQVARGLWWEPGDHLAFYCILQINLKGSSLCRDSKGDDH